ncbi:MAG: hypothetical protein IH586_06555 [Anaerolineaceae bacterium]|nr:hypothetical protein [Anaerolineaceae bacterium]
MPPSNTRSNQLIQETLGNLKPSIAFVVMIFGALIAFEIFNYSTTDLALGDLLGNLTFAGIHWSTILALAFCGIDFAGIARLFTPEQGMDEPKEVWYLFGAWMLAATMNAILTWWGVSMAVANHSTQSSTVIDPKTITTVVPVFVAIMVWVIRILIIGTLSLAMDRLMHPGLEQRTALQSAMTASSARPRTQAQTNQPMSIPTSLNSAAIPQRGSMSRSAAPNPRINRSMMEDADYGAEALRSRPDPTYHSLSMNARPAVNTPPGETAGVNNRFRRSYTRWIRK